MGFKQFFFLGVIVGAGILQSCSTNSHTITNHDHTRNQSRSNTHVRHVPLKKTDPAPGSSSNKDAALRDNSKIDKSGKNRIEKNVDLETQTRNDIVDYARQFLGIKYQYGGRNPRGFDCSGLTCHVMSAFNLVLPATSSQQARSGKKISWRNAQPGDLIFFGTGGRVNHVGIVTENQNGKVFVIHSTVSKGVKIDEITSNSYWKPRIMGAANYLSVSDSWTSH